MEPKAIGHLICPMPEVNNSGESGNRGEIGLRNAESEKLNGSVTLLTSVSAALLSAEGLLKDIDTMLFCEKAHGKAKTTFSACGEIHSRRPEKRKSENDDVNGSAKQKVSNNEAAALRGEANGGESEFMSIRNEIKSMIVREGTTLSDVLERLQDEYGWSSSLSNFTAKLRRESVRYREVIELADILGYDIVWQKRR